MSDIELSNQTSVSNAKRGRGRPKKQLKNGVNNNEDNVKNGNNTETKQTKKRGRKPNNVNDNDNQAIDVDVDVDADVDDGDNPNDGNEDDVTGAGSGAITRKRNLPVKAESKAKSVGKRVGKRSASIGNARRSDIAKTTTGGAKRRGRGRPPKSKKTVKAASNVDMESTPDESNDEEIDED